MDEKETQATEKYLNSRLSKYGISMKQLAKSLGLDR